MDMNATATIANGFFMVCGPIDEDAANMREQLRVLSEALLRLERELWNGVSNRSRPTLDQQEALWKLAHDARWAAGKVSK
jgi:hypothetical protein